MRPRLLLPVLFLSARLLSHAQAGSLDNSFAGNGKKQTAVAYGGSAVAVQPIDQKIVVASNGNSVIRYTVGGTLDTDFGSGGIANISFGSVNITFHAIAVQSDGKIVVAGSYLAPGGLNNLFVARLTTSGVIDGSFNNIGFNTVPNFDQATGGEPDGASGVVVQPDGKIVVCGEYYNPATGIDNKRGPFYFGLVRFTTGGQLDNTFGTGGLAYATSGSQKCVPAALALTATGKIIVAGYRMNWLRDPYYGMPDSVMVMQFTTNGVLDVSNFGTTGSGGIAHYLAGAGAGYGAHANAITLQSDGKILLAGYYLSNGTDPDFLIMRLNANGTPDNSFAGNGKQGIGFGHADYADGIGIEPGTGAIVVSGITEPSSGYKFAVCRIDPTNGLLDHSFNSNGMVTVDWTSSVSIAAVGGMAIQSNGRIVVTGEATNNTTATIRLLSSGSNFVLSSDSATLIRSAAAFSTDDQHAIKLFPNPAATQLQVTGLPVNEPVTLTVTDMGGNTLFQQRTGGGNVLLDISRLTSAAYVLSIAGTTTRQSLPFIKGSR